VVGSGQFDLFKNGVWSGSGSDGFLGLSQILPPLQIMYE
jgi:hypothetical protein